MCTNGCQDPKVSKGDVYAVFFGLIHTHGQSDDITCSWRERRQQSFIKKSNNYVDMYVCTCLRIYVYICIAVDTVLVVYMVELVFLMHTFRAKRAENYR